MFKEFPAMCNSQSKQCQDYHSLQIQAVQNLFMAQVSHELRTPLTKILSSAQLIECSYEKWSDEKKLKYLGVIQEAALELMELLNHQDFEDNLREFAEKNFDNHL